MSDTHIQDQIILSKPGVSLAACIYTPVTPNNCLVIIGSAMGIKQSFYRHYAQYLAEQGFTAATFDYRSLGLKPSALRHDNTRFIDWADDLNAIIAWGRVAYPTASTFVVGHSLGGQLIGLTSEAKHLSGILGIASQSGYWNHWPWPRKALMWSLWHIVIPTLCYASGYFPANLIGVGDPMPKHVGLDWARGGRQPRYILDLYSGTERDHYAVFEGAQKLISFADDEFAPRQAVDALALLYPNAHSQVREHIQPRDAGLEKIGHFGFFREASRATLWPQTSAWLLEAAKFHTRSTK